MPEKKEKSYTLKEICEGVASDNNIALNLFSSEKIEDMTNHYFRENIHINDLLRKMDDLLSDPKNTIKNVDIGSNENGLAIIYCSFTDNNEVIKNPEALYIETKNRRIFVKKQYDLEGGLIFVEDKILQRAKSKLMESDENYTREDERFKTGRSIINFCQQGNLIGLKDCLEILIYGR